MHPRTAGCAQQVTAGHLQGFARQSRLNYPSASPAAWCCSKEQQIQSDQFAHRQIAEPMLLRGRCKPLPCRGQVTGAVYGGRCTAHFCGQLRGAQFYNCNDRRNFPAHQFAIARRFSTIFIRINL